MAPIFKKGIAMKKIVLLLLSLCLLCSFWGCKELPQDEMLITRAKELLPKTDAFNTLFYIEGVPVDTSSYEENGYKKADATQLSLLGITKIEDAKNLMKGVWSQAHMERVSKSSLMASVIDGNTIASYVYCYDKYSKGGVFQGIMVSVDGLPIQAGEVTYNYDTLRVLEKEEERATLEIDVVVKNKEGEEKTTTLDVVLVLENGVWLLDSNTAVVYPKDSYPLPH